MAVLRPATACERELFIVPSDQRAPAEKRSAICVWYPEIGRKRLAVKGRLISKEVACIAKANIVHQVGGEGSRVPGRNRSQVCGIGSGTKPARQRGEQGSDRKTDLGEAVAEKQQIPNVWRILQPDIKIIEIFALTPVCFVVVLDMAGNIGQG